MVIELETYDVVEEKVDWKINPILYEVLRKAKIRQSVLFGVKYQ